jgi:enterobactin synthetase component D
MITLIDNALDVDANCKMVSCHFDVTEFDREAELTIEQRWGVKLPDKLERAVNKRKAEFIAGRYCVSRALQMLPLLPAKENSTDIKIGEKRQPLWPSGLTGSITHSHGFAAAVVANTDDVRSIGIDSEYMIKHQTAENVASHILTGPEDFSKNRDVVDNSDQYLTLIFSAKESIFKCLYPLVSQYFDFKDAVISLAPDQPSRFAFVLQKTLNEEFSEGYTGNGIFQLEESFIHTAVILNR